MILILIFTIFIICLFFCIKNKELFIKNKELFSNSNSNSNNSSSNSITKNKMNQDKVIKFTNDFSFICTSIDGNYKIIIDNNLWGFIREPKYIGSISSIFNTSHREFNFKTGYYNYHNNTITLLDNKNNIYTLLLDDNKLLGPVFYKKIYREIGKYINNIDCLFYLNNLVYIFRGETVLIYCLTKDEILIYIDTNTIFKQCDFDKIECCFINNNHLKVYNPVPLIYVKNDNNVYIYEYKNYNNFELYKKITNKIDNYPINTELTPINYNEFLVNYTFDYDGYYRIITIGAGNTNGGNGGLIFNDYKFSKNDQLKMIIGGSGTRLPVKNTLGNNKLNNKLSFYGSCSGAGGTFIFKNDNVIMASGGGGGWSSEMIKAPDICNSLHFKLIKPTSSKIPKSAFCFPISKLKIETERTTTNNSYKLVIHKLDIKNENYDYINIKVSEDPLFDKLELTNKNKKYLYETSFTKYGEKASIEINFNEVLTDYTIDLNYYIKHYNKNEDMVNSILYLYDEQGRSYTINNFNFLFKKKLTSKNILSYLSKHKLPPIIKPSNKVIENGHSINKLNDIDNTPIVLKDNKIFLEGGIGGGGNSHTNRYAKDIYCGGGGGYIGGRACILSNYDSVTIPTTYIAGTGGASYIDKLNFKQKDILKSLFINNYNDGNGKILILKINESDDKKIKK